MNKVLWSFLFLVLLPLASANPLNASVQGEVFSALLPRSIGPANMSGRLTAIAVSPDNPRVIYVGSATGGLWKSENAGNTWTPIFDQEKTSSIGDVAIDPRNPNIIWVGTGEANPRNSVGVGRGVYKSLDAGKTWTCLGLEATDKISRILINPLDPDIVYVGALGSTWGESEHRGVYKTEDGGKTWQKVKYIGSLSGVADLAMDPANPNHLLAAFWEHRRWPWFFKSGGPDSGLFVTWDGGKTWQQQGPAEGFLPGELGRIGIAFAPGMPKVVYALVEAEKNTLLRSKNGGRSWQVVNQNPGLAGRPFYYCDIRVNPRNENTLYSLESGILTSEDGGKSFRSMATWTQSHPDYHAMWISPDGEKMLIGNDGGLVISRDRGETFSFVSNLPLAQFYHVSHDMEFPYHVYGGLQDNGSWKGPSTVLTDRAIYPSFWTMVGFGDGFDVEPDPENPDCGYAMTQGGALYYYNTRTARRLSIRPTPSEIKHRYSWNAALAVDPFKPKTIYYGSQFVHRSPDKGLTWEIISPDLTSNDPQKQRQSSSGGLTPDVTAAENHTTILRIAPSPLKEGLIWVATDDGHIQLTRDGGQTWDLVSSTLTRKDSARSPVPHGSSAVYIEPSHFDPATAFTVFDDHQRANWTPYVFVTHDYGKSWRSLATRDIDGFCHVIKQDRKNPDLLFLGTEFGLFFSLDGGSSWSKWTSGFPTVPVREVQIHPRDDDLIIATHGRAIYILDHIASLREMNEAILKKELHLFTINPTLLYQPGWGGAFVAPGDGTFSGQNRPLGAFVDYVFNPVKTAQKTALVVKVEILDAEGRLLRTLMPVSRPGHNRLVWDLRQMSLEGPWPTAAQYGDPPGLLVLPGTYTIRLSSAGKSVSGQVEVRPDPRLPFDRTRAEANHRFACETQQKAATGFRLYKELKRHQETLYTVRPMVVRRVAQDKAAQRLLEQFSNTEKRIASLIERMMPQERGKGIPHRPDSIANTLFEASDSIYDNFAEIPQNARVMVHKAQKLLDTWVKEAETVLTTDIPGLESAFHQQRIPLFTQETDHSESDR
jgi:photosystem II stability/assembly factor-like uncharacterized protein